MHQLLGPRARHGSTRTWTLCRRHWLYVACPARSTSSAGAGSGVARAATGLAHVLRLGRRSAARSPSSAFSADSQRRRRSCSWRSFAAFSSKRVAAVRAASSSWLGHPCGVAGMRQRRYVSSTPASSRRGCRTIACRDIVPVVCVPSRRWRQPISMRNSRSQRGCRLRGGGDPFSEVIEPLCFEDSHDRLPFISSQCGFRGGEGFDLLVDDFTPVQAVIAVRVHRALLGHAHGAHSSRQLVTQVVPAPLVGPCSWLLLRHGGDDASAAASEVLAASTPPDRLHRQSGSDQAAPQPAPRGRLGWRGRRRRPRASMDHAMA